MSKQSKKSILPMIVLIAVVILAGIGTGYALTEIWPKNQAVSMGPDGTGVTAEQVTEGKVFGETDATKFPDTADGVLVKGGIGGEGSHHLMRTGGPGRNVYLTSSVMDLDLFINHQVEVKGETFNAQKAGWLMDVGQVKVITLNAPKPFEEAAADDLMAE